MTSLSNAILAPIASNSEVVTHSLRLTNDNVRAYSTVPTAHVRDMVADGITGNGIVIYIAISDRQVSSEGEYFRSNESLALETGLKVSTVRKWLARLKKAGYLSIWTKNGGRRMRVCTKVCYPDSTQLLPSEHKTATQIAPYKENKIKKTLQQGSCVVSSLLKGRHDRALLGEDEMLDLVHQYGEERVVSGLQVWDAANQGDIENPIGWLAKAIRLRWKPRKVAKRGKFTECMIEHLKIIEAYEAENGTEAVAALKSEGATEARIAYKIWSGKI